MSFISFLFIIWVLILKLFVGGIINDVKDEVKGAKKEMKNVTADQTAVDRFQRTLEGIASQSLASN